jgi:predicted AAA+ superfamily ATPase
MLGKKLITGGLLAFNFLIPFEENFLVKGKIYTKIFLLKRKKLFKPIKTKNNIMGKKDIQDFFIEIENISKFLDIIPRDIDITLTNNKIIALVGPRRVGKTYFLLYLKKKFGGMYCDFEDPRLLNITIRESLSTYIELFGRPKFIFLDEVQEVEGWEKELRSLNNLKQYKIVVTGSSSKLLSKEISTSLRGRNISYIILSLSFKEFLKFKNIEIHPMYSSVEESFLKSKLREYLEFGGYPEVVMEEHLKTKILKEYFEAIYYKDLVERFNIKNLDLAKFLLVELIKNFSKDFSVNSFYKKCKSFGVEVSKDYLYSLISKISETMNFYFVGKFSYK